MSDLQSGASLFASRRPNNPMSLNNPDPHSIGGFVGRAISGAGSAVSEMGPLALDGLGAFANAERAGLSSDFEPKSQLGKLLADDNLTVGEKAKRIGLGALQGIADVVDGKPEAIGGALASWGAARLVASGSRATIAVDDLAAADGASRLGSRLNGSSEVTNSGPQISNLRTIRSADANAPFISDAAKAEGWYPPYADGPGVRTFTTAGDLSFVRLHTGEGNAPGGFLVRQEEIAHLRNDPAAIQNYLGLKDTPAYMSDVTVPVGTRMQVGIIGPQPNFGLYNNSGMQYQLLEQIPRSSFYNTRPLK
ncbi:hypothetical protein [Pandoraea sp. SD6-2]|uniref:hypothetical protein n=1 Tax=Pandoraea sp. SD6-2 TaxID=1286093 RepID=UPI0011866157|nr:hypothetical protein [Pandoraea sp. SD6-2]